MSDYRELSRSVAGLKVFLTGAASGMGRATARLFAAEGAIVALSDINGEGSEAVAKEIRDKGQKAFSWRLDVADASAIKSVVAESAAKLGGLDIIINNAGLSGRTAIDGEGYEALWEKNG